MARILIISLSNLKHDARVARQVGFLSHHQLTVAAFDAELDDSIKFIKIRPNRLSFLKKNFLGVLLIMRFYSLANKIQHTYPELIETKNDFDLIISNDIETLPLINKIKGHAKFLFDAHEYFPRQFEDKFMWRLLFQPLNRFICVNYLPKVDAMLTIGEGIAQEYEKRFKAKPFVINNAASYQTFSPSNSSDGLINLIHHGIAIPSRRLELMIEMFEYLDDRFRLNLMLISPQTANKKTRSYLPWLKEKASKYGKKIEFIDPVKSGEIIKSINKFDIGIVLVPPVNFNYQNGLGNKFFDFIQARLSICIGPIPEMAALVKKYDLGIVSEDFTPKALAMELNNLTKEKIKTFKSNSEIAAKEVNAEKNKVLLNKIIDQLLEK
ncbi:MAG: capsular biosynthesis protein [Bacteroidetes bacterium]|nr:capsular biosynthesis protein [Bacteroidota bacterium]